jgi:hypothetical protein
LKSGPGLPHTSLLNGDEFFVILKSLKIKKSTSGVQKKIYLELYHIWVMVFFIPSLRREDDGKIRDGVRVGIELRY